MFKLNEEFQYELLSDVGRELAQFYGAATGPFTFWAKRITVVLDPNGNWVLLYDPVSPKTHPAQVLADMESILE